MDQTINNTLLRRRQALLGDHAPLFYDEPVHIVRGLGTRLWDADNRDYLDCYNNVPCIGHSHPRFVDEVARQLAKLNTHTRYLHEGIVNYLEDLCGTFAAGFDSGILTCTGSEANDVALRTAWAVTGARGLIATDNTYHGNTHLVAQLSKNKTPIGGHEAFVRHVPAPDSYRGADSAEFASHIESAILDLKAKGQGFAALIICPLFANEGLPTLAKGWLKPSYDVVKRHGGLLICDEVQSGFGRTGTLWAHERIGVTPDLITLGKPMACGHPVGAMLGHRQLINAFRQRYSYFNTFGGNPVSVVAAQTTLNILRDEKLVDQAAKLGHYAQKKLHALQTKYPIIGDVRGAGLFFGAEFILERNRERKSPDAASTKHIVNGLRQQGVLVSRFGIHDNMLKIRPPLVFSQSDADELFAKLDGVMAHVCHG